MLHVASAILPIVLVVALGYLLTRWGLFSGDDISVLSRFVVKVALPLLVFANVYGRSAREVFQPTYLLTYAGVALVLYAAARVYGHHMGRSAVRSTFMGMGMSGTNNGFMGFPIFLILFPEWAGAAVGMGMIVDNVLIIPLGLFLAEHATGKGSAGERIRTTIKQVLRHPMVIAIIAALALNTVGLRIPTPLDSAINMLAGASSGTALFTIGGLLVGLRVKGVVSDIVVTVVGKLLVAPALAVVLVSFLGAVGLPELSPELRAAAILMCALPAFSILPAMAEPYGDVDVPTASMMLQTLLSFLTISAWMVGLAAVGWL